MTVTEGTITFDSTTSEFFRVWGSRIRQCFLDGGLVQHTDTGQIDWATVAVPKPNTQGENIAGYEVFRFNDTLQSTRPIFIKVEYGLTANYNSWHGTHSWTHPVVYVTVGSATSSAGAITGPMAGTRTRWIGSDGGSHYNSSSPVGGQGSVTAASPLHICGLPGYLFIGVGITAAAQPTFPTWNSGWRSQPFCGPASLIIERSLDTAGAPTGDGYVVLTNKWPTDNQANPVGSRPTHQVHTFDPTYPIGPQDGYWPIAMAGAGFGTSNFNGDVFYYPMPRIGPKPGPQSLAVLGVGKADIPLRSVQTITIHGAPHSYLSLAGIAGEGASDNARSQFWSGIPLGAVMVRWE